MEKATQIYVLLGSLMGGGGGYVGGDVAIDMLLEQGDKRWVTTQSLDRQHQWALEDEIAEINDRVANGTATAYDLTRRAVLIDRLKRLMAEDK